MWDPGLSELFSLIQFAFNFCLNPSSLQAPGSVAKAAQQCVCQEKKSTDFSLIWLLADN